jgi:hypothetical protein
MNFKQINIITLPKVGSKTLAKSCRIKYNVLHRHFIYIIKKILNNERNNLIIVGVRNPIDLNLSFLFESYNKHFSNIVRNKNNPNKFMNTYIKKNKVNKMINQRKNDMYIDVSYLIKSFFNKKYHNLFNEWFKIFFEITQIDKIGFDIEKGLQIYDLSNNNKIMVYTLEKLNINQKEICEYLNIPSLIYVNDGSKKPYKDVYNQVKKEIIYTQKYLDNLLNTDIIRFFYSETDIKSMYAKYTISS